MSFTQLERGGGSVVELYEFTRGATVIARYTSTQTGRRYAGNDFTPVILTRDAVAADDERSKSLTISLLDDDAVVTSYRSGASSAPLWVKVYALPRGSEDARVVFYGRVASLSFDAGQARLECTGLATVLQQRIPRYLVQRMCNNNLYDAACSLSKASFAVVATVATVSADGKSITTSYTPPSDGYLTAGFVEFGTQTEFIESQISTTVKLLAAVPGLIVGSSLTLYVGCDRLRNTCQTKFNNIANFEGFPYMPLSNPFLTGTD